MRILFMGTPDFAVASLKALVEAGHEICGVFTQPDKPKNRGMKMTFSPVKEYAVTVDLPVYQPLKMRDGEAMGIIEELAPELIVVAAYGKILPKDILDYPKHGCINVHSSILPKYRGAAPINWALLDGEQETGVTIMYMAEGLDTGDIIAVAKTPIDPAEDALQLTNRLAELGAETLLSVVKDMEEGKEIFRTVQDDSLSCYASMLSREMSPVDWSKSAQAVINQIRGLIPWPCATTEIAGVKVKLFKAELGETTAKEGGSITRVLKDGIEIACGDHNTIIIRELQGEGGRRMPAADYLRGHPIHI